MNNQPKMQELGKTVYTKPTLIEYGSLAERTRMFGFSGLREVGFQDSGSSVTDVVIPT